MSLVPIFAGCAPCSRHLQKLSLDDGDLNAADMELIMAAVTSPQGVRLTDLMLYRISMGDE
eukprot:54834-Eustigmatos_ZCMA.PRE.1